LYILTTRQWQRTACGAHEPFGALRRSVELRHGLPLHTVRRCGALFLGDTILLLSIQFPIVDFRSFIETTGRLRKPGWPLPTPNDEFVRTYGAIRIRPRGGLSGWIGENEICEATRAIRLSNCLKVKSSDTPIPFRVAFRRFFFDGIAAGKFELGLATKSRKPLTVTKQDIKFLIERFLLLKVRVRQANGGYVECPLIYAGKHLANSYLTATTQIGHIEHSEEWWVLAGSPLLFLECGNLEQVYLPFYTRKVDLPDEYAFELQYCLVPFKGGSVRMWFLEKHDSEYTDFHSGGRGAARRLRIYLQRLNAEHECLRLILQNVIKKTVSVVPRSDESAALQSYFNQSTKRIGILEAKSSDQFDQEICELARESMKLLNPGQIEGLRNLLESFDLRKNILSKLVDYAKNFENVSHITIIEKMEGTMNGDVFQNINQSIIATRGSIAKGVISLQTSGKGQIAEAISKLDQLIAAASDDDLSPEKKKESTDLLNEITEQANKQEPNKSVLHSLGNTLLSILTSVDPLAKAAKAAFDILKSLWA
jgi:hypothetical protein